MNYIFTFKIITFIKISINIFEFNSLTHEFIVNISLQIEYSVLSLNCFIYECVLGGLLALKNVAD